MSGPAQPDLAARLYSLYSAIFKCQVRRFDTTDRPSNISVGGHSTPPLTVEVSDLSLDALWLWILGACVQLHQLGEHARHRQHAHSATLLCACGSAKQFK